MQSAVLAALFVTMFLLMSHVNGRAEAYLDPGTGSVALQLILGGIVAVFATIRLYWDRLKTLVRRTPAESDVIARQ